MRRTRSTASTKRSRVWAAASRLVGTLAFATTCLFGATAHAGTIVTTLTEFTGTDSEVSLTLDDMSDPGNIVLTLEVAFPLGDLRGVWLHINDESLLAGMSASGADVTTSQFAANAVSKVGNAGINGGGTPCPCDIGIEIGTPGAGKDDIQSTSITLSHAAESLTLALFQGELVGARLTSVTSDGKTKGREGSSKLSGLVLVPEPGTATLALLGLTGLTVASRRRLQH